MEKRYDVIIVGGRVAGASLAIRLGRQDLNVLLVERAGFPSWPSVPSSPIIHPGTMRLLERLGLSEDEYAYPDAKVTHMILDMMGRFQAIMPAELLQLDRNYFLGLDRHKFDTALWQRAASLPNITACQKTSMLEVVKDDGGCVIGILCKTEGGDQQLVSAGLVVGADGRFSMAAQKFGATILEEMNEYPSSTYHAEWHGVARHSETYPRAFTIFQLEDHYTLLCIPIDTDKYIIANNLRPDHKRFHGTLEERYEQAIQSVPALRARLKNARRVSPVVGVRRVENGYRQAYGRGWALVGDAFHYESPLDGQGFYNALLASEFLAEAIRHWKEGMPWEEAGWVYQQRFYDSSHEMLQQTVKRVQQDLYATPPPFIVNTLIRWMLTDPGYQKQFLRYLSRAIDPTTFSFGPQPGPVLRGMLRDVQRAASRLFSKQETHPR